MNRFIIFCILIAILLHSSQMNSSANENSLYHLVLIEGTVTYTLPGDLPGRSNRSRAGIQVAVKGYSSPKWIKADETFYFLVWAQDSVTITAKASGYVFIEKTVHVPKLRVGSYYRKVQINQVITSNSSRNPFKGADAMIQGMYVSNNLGKGAIWIVGKISDSESHQLLKGSILAIKSPIRNYVQSNPEGRFVLELAKKDHYNVNIFERGYKPVARVVYPNQDWRVPTPDQWLDIKLERYQNPSDSTRIFYSGFVVDEESGDPIKDAEIQISIPDGITRRTYTDSTGVFSRRGGSNKVKKITVNHNGYMQSKGNMRIASYIEDTDEHIQVTYGRHYLKPNPENVPPEKYQTIKEIQSGSFVITGFIENKHTHKPVSPATVSIKETGRCAAADPKGYYQLHWIPPGSYDMKVSAPGYESVEDTVSIPESDGELVELRKDFILVPDTK